MFGAVLKDGGSFFVGNLLLERYDFTFIQSRRI